MAKLQTAINNRALCNFGLMKEKLREKYIDLLPVFSVFALEDFDHMMESSSKKIKRFSSVDANLGDELLSSSEIVQEKKRLSEDMKK